MYLTKPIAHTTQRVNPRQIPSPSPVDLPDTGIELGSPALQADSLPTEPPGKPMCKLGTLISIDISILDHQ